MEDYVADPTEDQTELTIGRFLKVVQIGDEVAIRETHGGLYTQAQGYAGNSWYVRTGRSCWYPTGQSHLVEPTPAVRAFSNGELGLGRRFTRGTAELYGTDVDRPGSMFSPLFYRARARGPRA
jgi:hypothetical protein